MKKYDVSDKVLKILIARMRGTLRNEMVVARYGGEEFVILLPNASIKAAVDVGWRLQKAITSSNFKVSNELEIAVTASFGVASKNDNCVSLANILKNADIALYEAKSSGRNTVISYDEVTAKKQ